MTTPFDLRVDARTPQLTLDSEQPEFAWRLGAGSDHQTAYQLQVSTNPDFDCALPLWDSGRVRGAQPFGVRYAGPPLQSGRRHWWRVRLWIAGHEPGPWSAPSTFDTGILDPALWTAQWVTGPAPSDQDSRALYLRGSVDIPSPLTRARIYVSALGWYRFFVNGNDLTGPALVPRWTPFHDYVEYQVYDVTDDLRQGVNLLAMAVGDGRYRGRLGVMNSSAVYGDRLAGFAQLHVELADGSTITAHTDHGWHAGTGRILTSDPKRGEHVDLRVTDADWLTDVVPPPRFVPAAVLTQERRLITEQVPPVRDVQRLQARSITRTPSGTQIVDFGQNFAGVTRIRLRGPSGTTVRLTHSEIVGVDGELDTDYIHPLPIGHWEQRDEVVLGGDDLWWQPWFTIHGFRYVEVDGLPTDLTVGDVEGVVLSTDLPPAGSFDCSDSRLNQLRHNVSWSLRSNFVDTPTDCPTRERSGWTGDIALFAPTATTFVDVQAYLHRYLRNVAAEQLPDGRVPTIIPSEHDAATGWRSRLGNFTTGSVGWGDVTVMLPWTLYQYYGDRAVLERQYESMTAWVDQLARRAQNRRSLSRRWRPTYDPDVERYLLDTGFHFGEWLRPGTGAIAGFLDGLLRGSVVATAYLEHSARTLADIGAVIGRNADAARYRDLADHVRHAWREAFLHDDGRIGTDRQDDYVRALAFDLVDQEERPAALDRLVALIERADGHLGTGFLSTPMLLPVLVDGGRSDIAWQLLLQTSSPSWLHQIERGATTVWETWEGYDAKGRATLSHNHYAFGAVAGFLTEHVAGISPAQPGYQVVDFRPLVGGGLTRARASVQTPYGYVASNWTREGDDVTLTVTIPPGVTGRIHVNATVEDVPPGTHSTSWSVAGDRPRGHTQQEDT